MSGPRHEDPAAAHLPAASESKRPPAPAKDPDTANWRRQAIEKLPPPIFLAIFVLLALYILFSPPQPTSLDKTTSIVPDLNRQSTTPTSLANKQDFFVDPAATMSSAEQTFIAIKPDGVMRGLIGPIISRFETRGFKLVAIKLVTPGKAHLETHYADLAGKPFFPGLIEYMASGPICAMVWEGRDAVKTGRTLLGATNPLASAPGTIRGDYAIDVGRNVCHGSDSVENAKKEIALWFKEGDAVQYKAASFDWIYEKA